MTQSNYQRKQAARLQFCIDNLRICEDCGMYAVVPSASDPTKTYIVGINAETLYSIDCHCEAAQRGMDCVHCNAVDRTLDEARDMRKHAAPLVAQAVKIVAETAAIGNIEHAYEVLAPTKDVTRCRHCNKPSRSGLCYQCNEY